MKADINRVLYIVYVNTGKPYISDNLIVYLMQIT